MAITFMKDNNDEVTLFENEFKALVRDYIKRAIVNFDYAFELITSEVIAEDITGIFWNHGLCEKAVNLIEGELLNLVNGTFWILWNEEQSKWHYFIKNFDKSKFKDGYVIYKIKVVNNVITHDDYDNTQVELLFSDVYNLTDFTYYK